MTHWDPVRPATLMADRYRVLERIAEGGHGVVYAGLDLRTDASVALKVLRPHVLRDAGERSRFLLEAKVAGRVGGDHIVKVTDADLDQPTGLPFLVMELLRGKDLETLAAERPLGCAETSEYLRQAATGISRAHNWIGPRGAPEPIIHRDLKPENLFLTRRDDGTPLIKLLDFGIAKVLARSGPLYTQPKGTPLYMAPEQMSSGALTPATDVWALGLIAFYLLTGRCYWRAAQSPQASWELLLVEVQSAERDAPRARLREFGLEVFLPAAFDDWFRICVHHDPGLRFQSALQAARALGEALGFAGPTRVDGEFAFTLSSLRDEAGAKAEACRAVESSTGGANQAQDQRRESFSHVFQAVVEPAVLRPGTLTFPPPQPAFDRTSRSRGDGGHSDGVTRRSMPRDSRRALWLGVGTAGTLLVTSAVVLAPYAANWHSGPDHAADRVAASATVHGPATGSRLADPERGRTLGRGAVQPPPPAPPSTASPVDTKRAKATSKSSSKRPVPSGLARSRPGPDSLEQVTPSQQETSKQVFWKEVSRIPNESQPATPDANEHAGGEP